MTPRPCFLRQAVRRARGFSLLELMVVVGILAVLMSLLLPVARGARAQAKAVSCASQLHQIFQAGQVWSAQHQTQFSPAGWPNALLPFVNNQRLYVCPADENKQAAGGGTINCALHIQQTNYNIPCLEGQWARKSNASGNSYTLSFEDLASFGGGDMDFNDIVLRFTENGDGTTTVTVVSKESGYTHDLIDVATGNVLLPRLGDTGGSPPGTSIVLGKGYGSSYALNVNAANLEGKSDKVYGLDYSNTVIATPATDNWTQRKWQDSSGNYLFARHRAQANILWGDGSVRPVLLNPKVPAYNMDPSVADNATKHWNVK